MTKNLFATTCFTAVLVLFAQPFCQFGQAQELVFSLQGMAGSGLTSANEPGNVINGGSGDIGPTGIRVNLNSRTLSIDVHWGSANGFEDLSSDVEFMNMHGPTLDHAPNNFTESVGVLTGLSPFDPSASSGSFVGEVQLSGTDLVDLLEGRFYVHLHTFDNPNGEARGYMIPEVRVGDVNLDGLINLLDVDAFIDSTGGTFVDEADINRDGAVNLLDVEPFVELLSG